MRKASFKNSPKNLLNLWERMEFRLNQKDSNARFVTRVEDLTKNAIIVEKPVRIAGNLELAAGRQIEVVFNRDDATYTFDAVVTSIDSRRNDIMTIEAISEIKRSQRRRFVRIDIAGDVTFKIVKTTGAEQAELSLDKKGELLNISAGGILLCTDAELKKDDLVLLNFWLKNSQRLENVLGLVKRREESKDVRCDRVECLVGIEFLTKEKTVSKYPFNLSEYLPLTVNFFNEALQQAIVQFVYRQQVENRKKTKVNS